MWRSQSALSSMSDYEKRSGRVFKKEPEIIQVQPIPAYINNFQRDVRKLDVYFSWIMNKPFISRREQKINTLEMAVQDLEEIIRNYKQADNELQKNYNQCIDKIDELGSQLKDVQPIRENWTQQVEFLKSELEAGNFRYVDSDKNPSASQRDTYISNLVKLHNKTSTEISERVVKRAIERELSGIDADLFDLQLKMDDMAMDIVGLYGLCQFYKNARECTRNIIRMSSQGVSCGLSYSKMALELESYSTGMMVVIEKNFQLHKSLYEVKKEVDYLTTAINKQLQVLNTYATIPNYEFMPKLETGDGKQTGSMVDKALEIWENI